MFVIVIAAVGVIVAMMVLKFVSSRMGSAAKPQQLPVPEASFSPFEVRVRTVKRNTMPLEQGTVVATSDAVASVCGADETTAGRYEARNDALRSIMRSRSLTKEDAAALLDYLASTNDQLRAERVAALKNDVMNLQRRQETPVAGLAETLPVLRKALRGAAKSASTTPMDGFSLKTINVQLPTLYAGQTGVYGSSGKDSEGMGALLEMLGKLNK